MQGPYRKSKRISGSRLLLCLLLLVAMTLSVTFPSYADPDDEYDDNYDYEYDESDNTFDAEKAAEEEAAYEERMAEENKGLPVAVEAPNAVVYCVNTGSFVYDKKGDEQIYPASCTKILTAIVALENGHLEDEITVPEEAVYDIPYNSSHIALEPDEKITFEQAMYGLLLCSGNDCAITIADYIAGSTDAFADMQNAKAKEIGCTGTHFTNPHGLFDKDHYTTCKDLARMMDYAIEVDHFVEIDSSIKYVIPKTNKSKKRELWNSHRMIKGKYHYYEPVICGKSGYVEESGCNLVTYGEKDGVKLIVVVCGCNWPNICCDDTRKLMEYYFDKFSLNDTTLTDIGENTVEVEGKQVPVVTTDDILMLLPKKYKAEKLTYSLKANESVTLPVEKDDIVGTLTCTYDDGKHMPYVVGTAQLKATKKVKTTGAILVGFLVKLIIIVASLLVLLLLVRAYNKRRYARIRKRRRQQHQQPSSHKR